ncbi:sugar phosphate isomerase/epimerase family protein [Mycolicibacterium smegmatis]|uniref:Xylose isomerase-like TIM barrel n=1 Tax=Mycolicibacterium smegmatis (strain MKD8) TaxID=1214915 RepID=A0A2U9PIB5_MYCSE|nr:sugar phosphate isomerase/epimerase [Mycolicibacterium smegmatis]AWT51476.1 Xylose isomerase-like TIM barrel [Mycolicibacterium smegmatis MKD8]
MVEPTAQVSDLTDDAGDVKRLIEEAGVDREPVKVMLDTLHVFYRQDDIRAQIREAGTDLGYVHLSDVDRRPPGASTDFSSVIDELNLVGYNGWLTMEIGFTHRDVDPDGTARSALAHIRGVLSGSESRIAPWRRSS